MRITTVDARSDEPHEAGRFAELVAVQAASMAALHAGPSTAWTTEELRAMRRTRTDFAYADRLAQVGDTAVGMLAVALPQQDNTEAALIMLHVLPQHRRRGVGSALLAEAEDIARRTDGASCRRPPSMTRAPRMWARPSPGSTGSRSHRPSSPAMSSPGGWSASPASPCRPRTPMSVISPTRSSCAKHAATDSGCG